MVDWRIEKFTTVDTTMEIARQRAGEGLAEGLVISSDIQTKGHGRRGNPWISPPGNLYCSIILRPKLTARDCGQFSFLTAAVLADTIIPLIKPGHQYENKWPNDSLIGGRKFAGILLENGLSSDGHLDHLVIGIGVNIVAAPEGRLALNDALVTNITRDVFLNRLIECFDRRLAQFRDQGFKPIRAAWLANAKNIGATIEVRLPHETLQGKFNGIDENGALLLGLDKGLEKVIHSGEVFFGPLN